MIPLSWTYYQLWRDRFAEALDERFHPIEWLDWAVSEGLVTGFYGRKSALLADITDFPGGARVAGVFYAVGDINELMNETRPRAEEWAKAMGCTDIIPEGRPGWVKALKKYGYQPHKMAVAKEL